MNEDEPIRCVQCGQTRGAVKESQRRGGYHKILCGTVDYFGECEADRERHKFPRKRTDAAA